MNPLLRFTKKFFFDEHAATAVEYAVMLAIIVLGAIGAILSTGDVQQQLFQSTADDLDTFMNP